MKLETQDILRPWCSCWSVKIQQFQWPHELLRRLVTIFDFVGLGIAGPGPCFAAIKSLMLMAAKRQRVETETDLC
jgi:hypothetical protein